MNKSSSIEDGVKSLDKNRHISISTPWHGASNSAEPYSEKDAIAFIESRSQVHSTYIVEQSKIKLELEKTKRLYLIIAAVLFIISLLVVTFAPEGRETLSYWIGGTLLLFSAGASGYKRLWAKAPLFSFEASDIDKS